MQPTLPSWSSCERGAPLCPRCASCGCDSSAPYRPQGPPPAPSTRSHTTQPHTLYRTIFSAFAIALAVYASTFTGAALTYVATRGLRMLSSAMFSPLAQGGPRLARSSASMRPGPAAPHLVRRAPRCQEDELRDPVVAVGAYASARRRVNPTPQPVAPEPLHGFVDHRSWLAPFGDATQDPVELLRRARALERYGAVRVVEVSPARVRRAWSVALQGDDSRLVPVPLDMRTHGLRFERGARPSALASVGLETGDVLVAIDGQSVFRSPSGLVFHREFSVIELLRRGARTVLIAWRPDHTDATTVPTRRRESLRVPRGDGGTLRGDDASYVRDDRAVASPFNTSFHRS